MGIERGAVAYLRGQLVGLLPAHPNLVERMREKAFRDIDPRSEIERTIGFCDFFDPMDIEMQRLSEGRYGIRIDTLKVPGNVLKMRVDDRCKRRCAEQGREKLTRREKDAIKLEVKRELRLRTLPRTAHVQLIIEPGSVRLFSTSQSVWADVIDLLEKALGMSLQVRSLSPQNLAIEQVGEDKFLTLQPERWHLVA